MSEPAHTASSRGLAALRRLASRPPEPERCVLCASPIGDEHQHLIDPQKRRILCTCVACSILFDESGVTQYRRVPRDIRALAGMEIDDGLWNSLAIPIGLVFFFRSTAAGRVMALYPSPAGPAETTVEDDLWDELSRLHPSIAGMRADVEALLVNRVRDAREYFIAPIDECYKLTGVIRRHWRGFTGSPEAWEQIALFFEGLKRRASLEEARTCA